MTFRPVIAGAGLPEDEIIRSEDLAERAGSDGVHRAWLEIDEDGARYVFTTGRLIVVYVYSFELEVGIAMVRSSWVDAVFVGDDFPEL